MLILLYSFFNPEARELRTEMRNFLVSKQYPTRIFCSFDANAHYRFPRTVNIIRALDYSKIAACPDSSCACYSLNAQFSPSSSRSFSSPYSVPYCKKINCIRSKGIEDLLESLMQNQSACRSGRRFFFVFVITNRLPTQKMKNNTLSLAPPKLNSICLHSRRNARID